MAMGKNRTKIAAAAIIAVTCAAVTYFLAIYGGISLRRQSSTIDATKPFSGTPDASKMISSMVRLYFADKEYSFLIAEERTISHSVIPEEFGRAVIENLIKGSQENLMRTIPAKTGLRSLFLTSEGIAYVDLTPNIYTDHPGGTTSELFSLYSIVNSLILNIPEIKMVKILIDGREALTLAGHIDLRNPFKADMLLIK
jgi:spore germination protein GerM